MLICGIDILDMQYGNKRTQGGKRLRLQTFKKNFGALRNNFLKFFAWAQLQKFPNNFLLDNFGVAKFQEIERYSGPLSIQNAYD